MVNQERLKKQEKTFLVSLQPLVTWSLPVVCQLAHGILTVGGLKAFGFVQLNQVRYSCWLALGQLCMCKEKLLICTLKTAGPRGKEERSQEESNSMILLTIIDMLSFKSTAF